MRKRIGCLAACLLLLALPARAVTVLGGGEGLASRLDAALEAMADNPVGRYGMSPIGGGAVADGTYPVAVESSSPFFRVAGAELRVSGGEMALTFRIGSHSYAWVCLAAAADAEAADWIEAEDAGDGARFTVPVPALNAPFQLAAYSVARQRWYDRLLLVDASSLPAEALGFELPDYGLIEAALRAYRPRGDGDGGVPAATPAPEIEPVAVDRPDGEYAIEVTLTGGSGRASVSSPTRLIVRDGRGWARLLWSSAYYDYMLLGGRRYENLSVDGGNSSFEIPIPAMDAPVDVIADTTAMGDPVEIAYQLTFYGDTVGDVSQVPQEGAKRVLILSLAIIVGGGILNHIAKRKRK